MERSTKIYDLEERTAVFAEQVRDFCRVLPKNAANSEYVPQLIRSGSSPGANYIEANESIGDKDFKIKIKTCRRESKVAKEILGAAFVDHFTQTREWEWRQHLKAVTDWEYKRYFEII